ncbi:Serine/threonine-protein kinase PrkC [Gemmata obscuriglobus]|uniref:Serine/threonine protein kinase n=1 Tax=Gemmata obscuriglobus TaxID=114 RepID=A0A2Z3H4V9_9BACT|nr:protein kinase [Gemmata obscuriglobus]AWM36040.1 serine/threonine protein kinase [Gemmata obscuriglobus]QEG31385.1 Serine/threonine-protein kinase PrkC [Gemmata obscuriglobus]VTS10725.1 serine threonine protein kinase : Serine/threonine protein kinase OS=Singulisphaera acidiphila (strain ATCC BAA-1392 / DSM 18658 / VKM B-2454 / MOB10) GN=Sinac_6649 PE=3 SV=1: Pkinase: Pkinase: TPR_11: TPR_11 [Gemmata obscuriglobus UQM 2246]
MSAQFQPGPAVGTDCENPKTAVWDSLDPAVGGATTRREWRPGDHVLGFTLVEFLGKGTFAQVFLAEQEAIAGRLVVLKVTSTPTPEPDRLGRLQHPNVVPIHSVHSAPPHELICMPYLGRTTLADVLRAERYRNPSHPTRFAHSGSSPTQPGTGSVPVAGLRMLPAAPPGDGLLGDHRRVLRLLSDLAAGLDHAHHRGILHLDIKPANVLLADTGEPMLLDFNLAHDTTATARGPVGGTLPYAAPEQLAEIDTRAGHAVDERADLYALGALAYELFTAEQAFPAGMMSKSEFKQYIANRRTVPSVRAAAPAVPRAVDAIVRKLLAPSPADRYQTALELKTDLDRQLADLPLASAPDRSPVERLGKWHRRNPWLALRLALAAVVGLALGFGVVVYRQEGATRARAAAEQALAAQNQMPALRLDLTAPGDSPSRARGRAAAERHLAAFGLPGDDNWRNAEPFARLPDGFKPGAAADLGELLLLLAHARTQDARALPEDERAAALREALRLNRLAEGCFAPDAVPPFLFAQRARLDGEPAPAPTEPRHPRDHYLEAVGLIADGRFRAATGPLERTVAGAPAHGAAHFALAFCRQQLGQYQRALERYDTAHALLARDPRPAFNRGIVYGLMQKHPEAEAEFALALAIDPGHAESHRNRAVARLAQRKHPEAEQDLTAALEKGVSPLLVYPLRAQLRALRGDATGAEQDRAAAAAHEPKTESEFIARGLARLAADPAAALRDFEAAERVNPTSLRAVQNQAHVHSDHRKDSKRALELVTRAAELYPEYAPARAGRAVLLARFGRRAEAHKEAETALTLSDAADVAYQLAGVYALTSATAPADAGRAFELLRQALRTGFRDARTLAADPDLDPIRNRPEFGALVAALKDLNR